MNMQIECGPPSTHKPGYSPLDRQCCHPKTSRRCPCRPFLFPVAHPPWFKCPPSCPWIKRPLIRKFSSDTELWYEKDQDYMPYDLEDQVMPANAFWFYCDHIPDGQRSAKPQTQSCHRPTTGGWIRPKDPWPPLTQGACPPPRECEPCGPGPWANPALRRFFYYDCV